MGVVTGDELGYRGIPTDPASWVSPSHLLTDDHLLVLPLPLLLCVLNCCVSQESGEVLQTLICLSPRDSDRRPRLTPPVEGGGEGLPRPFSRSFSGSWERPLLRSAGDLSAKVVNCSYVFGYKINKSCEQTTYLTYEYQSLICTKGFAYDKS